MPLMYGMEPALGLVFLLSIHAVSYTGGAVTAVLLGIPGDPANAATVTDGHALARRGRAGYAIGAALGASGVGGVFGAVVLLLLLPVCKLVAMLLGSPETLMLSVLGLFWVARLSRGSTLDSLAAAGLGVFLSCFGYQGITGVPRFWLGNTYLLDGIPLIPLITGLFAIPEVLELLSANRRRAVSADFGSYRIQVLAGIRSVYRKRWLTLRSAVIGVMVGIMPGVGGITAPFLAYGAAHTRTHARGSQKWQPIDGVIAPESSNNAKEGGSLVPTLALGIPGSAAMAVLLGAFTLLGLEPGPGFLYRHMDLAIVLVAIVAITNIVAVILLLMTGRYLAKIVSLPGSLVAPLVVAAIILGTYASRGSSVDVSVMLLFGGVGVFLRTSNYNTPALLLGFVLGPNLETYFWISWQTFGISFLLRPISLALLALIMLSVPRWRSLEGRWTDHTQLAPSPTKILVPMAVGVFLIAFFTIGVVDRGALDIVMAFPALIVAVVVPFCAISILHFFKGRDSEKTVASGGQQCYAIKLPGIRAITGVVAVVPCVLTFDYSFGLAIYVLIVVKAHGHSWRLASALGCSCLGLVAGVFGGSINIPLNWRLF